ncbi:Solute carrier family 22 member 8 [Frankliniella fusca]|uniref:Solute carrier family 22 member 8 n=1 Tax=Frankliniella fusca TaxID=407009 RepID=A0AAE1LK36_9NEOP|nr:Solute carrier family 22 member 8 [Frankliniella fusca]
MTAGSAAAGVTPEVVDRVLLQIGKVGPFQIFNCIVINMPILFSALYTIAYVFTAQELNYSLILSGQQRPIYTGLVNKVRSAGRSDFVDGCRVDRTIADRIK